MEFELIYAVPEVVEQEVAGVIVQVTKLHFIQLPVQIVFDLETRSFFTSTGEPTIGALVNAEAVGLAEPAPAPKPKPFDFYKVSETSSGFEAQGGFHHPFTESLEAVCNRAQKRLTTPTRKYGR